MFRLKSSPYQREKEDEQIEPAKVFFLSVEGNLTEKEYFNAINKYRKQLQINGLVTIEVLERSDKVLLLAGFALALPKTFAKTCSHILPHNGLKLGTLRDAKL